MADNTKFESVQEAPFIVLAFISAKAGKGDQTAEGLAKIRAYAESDKEPDTLTFRPARGVGGNPEKFIIFEKYISKEAFEHHKATNPAIAELTKADVCTIDKNEFFDEIGAFERI